MNKKQSKHGLARVWPALGVVAIVAAGLTGVSGAWAADASAPPAKPPETPAAAADETVVLDDALMWRIYRVEGQQHIREKDGKLSCGQVSGLVGCNSTIQNEGGAACRHTQPQNSPAGSASASGFCGTTSILPPADWAGLTLDDGAWPRFRLPQPFVFAQDGPNQTMNLGGDVYDTVLLLARARFEVKDPARVKACRLSLVYWGGVVVYVNGKEVARGSLPGQTSDWGEPAEDYPEEVFLTPGGKPLTISDEKSPDRLEKRQRRLTNVTIPAAALRPGVNVIAIEAHPAPVNAKVFGRNLTDQYQSRYAAWPTVGLLSARLTVSPAGAAKPPRPGGVQVWNAPTSDKVSVFDVGNPLDPLQPLVIRAARNTVFSGRLMVGSDQPIRGLKATVGDLAFVGPSLGEGRSSSSGGPTGSTERPPSSGGPTGSSAKIPAAAVRVRYAVAATPDRTWVSPNDFDGLFDAIPAEIPVAQGAPGWDRYKDNDLYSGTARRFFHFTPDRTALKSRAVAPLWFTVKVPREIPAGVYEGQVSISAEGLAAVKVPLRVHVSAWTAPNVRDYCVQNYLFQSEESVMNYYGVPPYSDKHLELVGKSLALAAELNHLHVEANLVIGYQEGTGGGSANPESLVRWVKQPDGTYKHDFTNFDRYLDMVAKAVGTPRVLALNHFTGSGKVTCLDPATGKLEPLAEPAARYAFWKPVYDEILKKLKARGWLEQTTLGAQVQCRPPDPREVFLGNKLWPGAEWSFTSHMMVPEFIGTEQFDNRPGHDDGMKIFAVIEALSAGRNADKELQAAGLTADQIIRAPVRHSDYTQGNGRHTDTKRPLYFGPRHDATAFNPRTAFWGCGENLPEVRRLVEAVVYQKGVDGVGEQGVDLFPLKTKVGGYGFSPTKPGTHWPNYDPYMRALLYPGPDGPVATERFEMFREGLQLMEIRMFLERAVAEKKVNPELWKRAAAELWRPVKSSGQLYSFFYRCFQSEADAKLLDMAGEVVGDLPFAANTPASELAAVVERVAAKPTDAESRKQVWRLRSVTSALTPAQLGRLYGCLKTEPQANFELPELVAVLGRAFGVRCGGDEGKLGQVLGDPNALQFLRGYVQAAAESTNATLKAWARTDGAILLPLANGLRAQYYGYGGDPNKWENNNLAERLVERIVTPDQTLGLPGFEFGENKRVSIAVRWTGFIDVKTPGKYTFYALADDGARLWVDDTLLTESYKSNDGVTVELAAGLHPFKVEYWKHHGQCSLEVMWSGPGFERQPIGADVVRTPAVEQKR